LQLFLSGNLIFAAPILRALAGRSGVWRKLLQENALVGGHGLPDTKTIRLTWPAGYDIDFKTGQFITLYWPDTPAYKRAYHFPPAPWIAAFTR